MGYIIGIDPGSKAGALAVLGRDGRAISWHRMPTLARHSSNDLDGKVFAQILRAQEVDLVILEEVHAIHGTAAGTMFAFGGMFHGPRAIIQALELPMELIAPKKWQKAIHGVVPKDSQAAKERAIAYFISRFPSVERPKGKDLLGGVADAFCLAEFGRRRLTGEAA